MAKTQTVRAAAANETTEQTREANAKVRKDGLAPLPALPKAARKPKPTKPCACGCGLSTRSTWFPGHDARHHGWVLRVLRGVVALEQVPDGEREVVRQALVASGWLQEGSCAQVA